MNHKTKYPAGSPRDILIRLRRVEREIHQMLREVRSVNDDNPNFADSPMDIGRYLVRLKTVREVIAKVQCVIATGEPKVPDGMLDPIIKMW